MKSDINYSLQIVFTSKQAELIEKAIDLYTRLGTGQFEAIVEALKREHIYEEDQGYEPLKQRLIEIKESVLHMPGNADYAIAGPEVTDDVKILYDLQKSIQKGMAVAECHRSTSTWNDGDYLHLGSEPTPHISIIRHHRVTNVPAKTHRKDGES